MGLTKPELRLEIRRRLRELGDARMAHSRAICSRIAQHRAYLDAEFVATFDPLPFEPHVELLWEGEPRRFLYPRVVDNGLALIEVRDPAELHRVPGFAFREPQLPAGPFFSVHDLDLILVPGIAFTRSGRRLGRGGGHYDRLLASLAPTTPRLGVCFSTQIVDDLPVEEHDMAVDAVITE
jgi:5-formyltetrahydrofolate cyclo-ligase